MTGAWARSLAAVTAVGALAHVAIVRTLPTVIMEAVCRRITAHGEKNTLIHVPPITAAVRVVVMPSPDLLYSVCVFDVSDRPLRIRAEVPDSYWSLAMFAANTDNFFVLNDRTARGPDVDILLAGPETPARGLPSGRLVRAPTSRGAVLIRILVRDPSELARLIELQHRASCAAVSS